MTGVRLVVTLACAVALLALPGSAAAGRWVAGDLHVHTTYSHDSYGGPSDDNTGPEDAYTFGQTVTEDFAIGVLEARFGTSQRKCRERLARLEAGGFVVSHQAHLAARKLYAVGPAGRTLLGAGQRRAPRWDTQATHELAIATLVAELEVTRPGLRVLTERDCRRAEADG